MKILAVDPGYERLGIAVLEKGQNGKEIYVYSDCFQTSAKIPFYERLLLLGNEIERVIQTYHPEEFSAETLFFHSNQKTAMKVSESRGAVLFQAKKLGLEIFEYTPLQIKTAITGDGRADKKQIVALIPKLISVPKPIKYDDEYDAIAVGLTHFAYRKNQF
ncbi:MAG TPA: crossover junction endodeoxyribonuclease RuvC [Candidatus Paceibacterota bacterium]|nr:crossover junction endodeoxyribonuclease RuvC [Candidatus Paceibacterota bacterium]